MKTDFDKIVLLPEEKQLLKQFIHNSTMPLSSNDAFSLDSYGFIKRTSDGTFRLSASGRKYLEYLKNKRRSIILNWSVNLSIAIISAVFGSGLTLFIQYCLMK